MSKNSIVRVWIAVACLSLVISACSSSPKKQGKEEAKSTEIKSFQLPEIPPIYTDQWERAKYMVAHYWDKFNFADTSLIHVPEVSEQAFVDFLQVLPYVPYADVEKEISGMLDKALLADTLMFAYFTELYDKYLYDPNSPMLNEEFYIPVLKYIVNSGRVGEVDKMRPAFRLEMALKNRVGNPATDFTYTLPSGKKGKLSGINADYTILFFNNPDCNACRAIKVEVEASELVKSLLNVKVQDNRKKLVFLSVFPDPELEVWRRMLPEQPKEWMCTYDDGQVITKERLYDLRAIPTFYLLDREKRVLLKDAPFRIIEAYLGEREREGL